MTSRAARGCIARAWAAAARSRRRRSPATASCIIASEDGDVFVVQAGREYAELGKYPMNEVLMASPAISNGVLIVRTLGHVWGIGR